MAYRQTPHYSSASNWRLTQTLDYTTDTKIFVSQYVFTTITNSTGGSTHQVLLITYIIFTFIQNHYIYISFSSCQSFIIKDAFHQIRHCVTPCSTATLCVPFSTMFNTVCSTHKVGNRGISIIK